MAASNISITQGSGTRLATNSYTEGGVTVHDEKMILGEPYLASYTVANGGILTATAASHLLQIMAGATLRVRIRRIVVVQDTLAGAVASLPIEVRRLTTAGTGGTVLTPNALDPASAASGATAMQLPTSKGTEGGLLNAPVLGLVAAHPILSTTRYEWSLTNADGLGPLIIAAGTANGICIKNVTGVATAALAIRVEFSESSF